MSDLSSYREKAANLGKLANQAETEKDYQRAFDYYTKALDIFSHMIKCKCPTISNKYVDEKNSKLVEIYKMKADEYFERAMYLKKQVL